MFYRIGMIVAAVVLLITCAIQASSSTNVPSSQPSQDLKTANWITVVLSDIRTSASATQPASENAALYRDAWIAAICFADGTKDADARLLILSTWNEAWRSSPNINVLSSALAFSDGDRIFLTKAVLEAWRTSDDPSTLKSIATWGASVGSDDDAQFVKEKVNSTKEVAKANILQNGLNWRNYRKNPAHGQPAMTAPSPG